MSLNVRDNNYKPNFNMTNEYSSLSPVNVVNGSNKHINNFKINNFNNTNLNNSVIIKNNNGLQKRIFRMNNE